MVNKKLLKVVFLASSSMQIGWVETVLNRWWIGIVEVPSNKNLKGMVNIKISYGYRWNFLDERTLSRELLLLMIFTISYFLGWKKLNFRRIKSIFIVNRKSYDLGVLVAREFRWSLEYSKAAIWKYYDFSCKINWVFVGVSGIACGLVCEILLSRVSLIRVSSDGEGR